MNPPSARSCQISIATGPVLQFQLTPQQRGGLARGERPKRLSNTATVGRARKFLNFNDDKKGRKRKDKSREQGIL